MSDYFRKGIAEGYLDILRLRNGHAHWQVVPLDGVDRSGDTRSDLEVDRVADLDPAREVALARSNPDSTDRGSE